MKKKRFTNSQTSFGVAQPAPISLRKAPGLLMDLLRNSGATLGNFLVKSLGFLSPAVG